MLTDAAPSEEVNIFASNPTPKQGKSKQKRQRRKRDLSQPTQALATNKIHKTEDVGTVELTADTNSATDDGDSQQNTLTKETELSIVQAELQVLKFELNQEREESANLIKLLQEKLEQFAGDAVEMGSSVEEKQKSLASREKALEEKEAKFLETLAEFEAQKEDNEKYKKKYTSMEALAKKSFSQMALTEPAAMDKLQQLEDVDDALDITRIVLEANEKELQSLHCKIASQREDLRKEREALRNLEREVQAGLTDGLERTKNICNSLTRAQLNEQSLENKKRNTGTTTMGKLEELLDDLVVSDTQVATMADELISMRTKFDNEKMLREGVEDMLRQTQIQQVERDRAREKSCWSTIFPCF